MCDYITMSLIQSPPSWDMTVGKKERWTQQHVSVGFIDSVCVVCVSVWRNIFSRFTFRHSEIFHEITREYDLFFIHLSCKQIQYFLFQVKKVKKEKKKEMGWVRFSGLSSSIRFWVHMARLCFLVLFCFFPSIFFGWLPRVVGTDYKNWKHVEPRFDSLYTY